MKMDNRNRTQENISIIRELYFNTKPAIISSIKKIITNASRELAVNEVEQLHSTKKSLAFDQEIVEQIVQEFDLFIENRVKGDYIDNNNNFISIKSDINYQREQKAHEQLDTLLKTAEKIETKKNSINQRINTIYIVIVMPSAILGYSVFDIINYSADFLTNIIAVTSFLVIFLAFYNLSQISQEYYKEKRALNKIVRIIQEVIPYHLKQMSVLEKANFEVRLARMNISVAGSDS